MKKRILTMLLAVVFIGGISLLLNNLPLGLSSNAYATPDKGNKCSKCHGPKAKDIPKEFKGYTNQFMLETCDGFVSEGSNPYFILEPGFKLILEGKEKKTDVKVEITVLSGPNGTKEIHYNPDNYDDFVVARIVEEKETKDGELAEISRNYFAICNRTNSVFYFGEEVDIYENGVFVGHEGAWEAGVGGARAGIIMPGVILLGGKYFQELAPGVALDRAEILSMTEALQTPAGAFNNCLKTEETSALEGGKSYKFYAPGIGMIKDGDLELTYQGYPNGI